MQEPETLFEVYTLATNCQLWHLRETLCYCYLARTLRCLREYYINHHAADRLIQVNALKICRLD